MDSDALRSFLVRAEDLPTLPEVALSVMRKIQDPDSSAQDIVNIIERDASMTARVLNMANSAFYGMSRRVDSLKMAVVVLGLHQCASIVMGISVFRGFAAQISTNRNFYYDLWRHLISTAHVAGLLSERFRLEDPAMVYTGGLLHDIGKIVYCIKVPEKYHRVLLYCREESRSLAEMEQREFHVTHDVLGGSLAAQWDFPPSIVNVLNNHHSLNGELDSITEVAAIALANCFCRQEDLGDGGNYENADFFTDNAWAPIFTKSWGKNLSERKEIFAFLLEQKQRISEMTEEFLEICTS
jgi:putative nucleotidyltransferase with HDIG domain